MKSNLWLPLIVALALGGCGPSEQQKADMASVQSSNVPSATYDKMVHGDDLSIADICSLERARVHEGVILRYMRNHSTIYVLSSNDINRLQQAGTSQSLIDYMQGTPVDNVPAYTSTVQVVTYAPYGPIAYYGPSASSYYGPAYYDPFWGPPY